MNHTPSVAAPQRSAPGSPGPTAADGPASRFSKATAAAVLVCWLLVVFDGYDLIVYGTVQSSLISETGWGLTKATAGTIGSMAFVGMMIGAIFAGRMADSWGRRRTILGCAIVFSVFTILCAFAPNAPVFGALRLLAGIGLGGLVPSANALVAELVPTKWRSIIATLMMSGVPIGGSIAALVGIQLIPAFGWESMFLVAALALLVVVPLGLKYLPETLAPAAAAGKDAGNGVDNGRKAGEPAGFSSLLRAPYLGISMLFALATIATLFAWYGLGTWLPNLMQLAGYNLGSALTFALALNLGAVAGSVLTAWAGTRFGPIPTAIAAAAVAAGALVVLVTGPSVTVVYLMLVLAGVGTHGTQCLIIAAVASHYPGHLRGTALGWALGTGRIGAVAAPQVGGLLLAAGLGVNSNFLAFAGAAAIAAVLLVVIGLQLSRKEQAMSEHVLSTNGPSTDVLVIGGGMAGLAGALALRENGAKVTLVERAPEFGEVGAGLQMAPNASRVLQRWGLLEKALEIGVQPKHLVFRDAVTGEELTRQTLGGEFADRYGAPYVVIHRSDLHRVLLEGCEAAGVKLVNDVMVESVETVNGRGVAHTAAGVDYEADVVIGADGLRSTLRPLVTNDEPVSSAYVAYRGTVPITEDTPKADLEDVIVYLGPDCHLVQYPLRKGELLNTVAVFKSPSFERGEEQYGGVDELEAAYKDCVPAVQEALKNLATGIRWPMYDRDPIESWVAGRMVLMGDAAHPMLQYLAQGACQALEDAAVLQDATIGTVFTDAGVNPEAWDGAIKEFNSIRAGRTARVQRTARVWGESWHVSGLARTLRNLLFKSRKDNDFQYNDWLYGQDGDGVPAVREAQPSIAERVSA